MGTLQGKRAIVIGGSRGIGAAIVKRLGAEGADVAFTYVNAPDRAQMVVAELEKHGRRGLAIKADSGDAAAVKAAVDQAAKAFDGLDILVNNAGVHRGGPLESITMEAIDTILAVNVRAVFVAAQAAAKHLASGGRIISIGSNYAARVPEAGLTLYSMTKSALVALTQGLARDLGSRGITANLVQPGATDTEMNPDNTARAAVLRARMAIPRYVKPEEVAALVAFVAGPEAGSINGATLTIDGGANA